MFQFLHLPKTTPSLRCLSINFLRLQKKEKNWNSKYKISKILILGLQFLDCSHFKFFKCLRDARRMRLRRMRWKAFKIKTFTINRWGSKNLTKKAIFAKNEDHYCFCLESYTTWIAYALHRGRHDRKHLASHTPLS